jgi:hypothetical protein
MWAFTQRLDYLVSAKRAARQIVNHQTNLDGKRIHKVQTWAHVKPQEVCTENDYLISASGVGSALLRVHLAVQGKFSAIRFPDNRIANAR